MSGWSLTCLACWREWIVPHVSSWETPCKCSKKVVRVKARALDGAQEKR